MTGQLCTLVLGDTLFGVDVLRVQEVIKEQSMTPIPLAHHTVAGLINLRGQIVTAIDMRRRMDMPSAPDDAAQMNVVVRTEEGPVSFLVDSIGDVIDVTGIERETPPETLPAAQRELIVGVFKLDGRLLMHLDVDRLTELETTIDVDAAA